MSIENKEHLLIDLLTKYNRSDYYGFHMPGHKRNKEQFGEAIPYGIDITEIEGFDDLHHCEGILLDSQKTAAEVFHAEQSFYLINGSTVGNLAAILAVTNRGDKILIARNNHKSVYNGVFLNDLRPVFVYPKFDEKNDINGDISKESIEECLLLDSEIKAVVIVSLTYDGVVSDVRGIAEVAHQFGIPLIVDEAHGAHLGFHEYFPQNSNVLGADIVVHSVHKTLPSLTQTGILHVNGLLVNRGKLKRYLKMLQSSSPSYVLMASIDACVSLVRDGGMDLFEDYVALLTDARERLGQLKHLHLIESEHFDKSKIIVSVKGTSITSKELYNLLLESYHLQMEMCGANYVTAMTSVGDTKDGFDRLVKALIEIDHLIEKKDEDTSVQVSLPRLELVQGDEEGSEWFYYLYPPGIPFVVPGEVITREVKDLVDRYESSGFTIQRG